MVFLLSATDANNTAYFADNNARICQIDGEASYWWLRSPGSYNDLAAVDDEGSVHDDGFSVDDDRNDVRPAFWLAY